MNVQESQFDEFKDEQKFKQLNLTPEQMEAWIMVSICTCTCRMYICPFSIACMQVCMYNYIQEYVLVQCIESLCLCRL